MKKVIPLLSLAIALCAMLMQSCSSDDSYSDLVKRERKQISSFISRGTVQTDADTGDTLLYVAPIKVISEEEFVAKDSTTDIATNEYVKLDKSGIYMQIVRRGAGEKIANGESRQLICRYLEFNISGDSVQSGNMGAYFVAVPDYMSVFKSGGTYTASFTAGVMISVYQSAPVPSGWLVPLSYVNIGRQTSEEEEISKVRLIVPHSQGTSSAQGSVYACFYEITYQRSR